MEKMENQSDNAFWNFFINAAVVVAAAILYFKTAEVMTALAPKTLIGQTGLSVLYGTATASLIEGVTLALHFLRRYAGNERAEYYKWFLFGVSTFCQFLDTSLVKDTTNQTQTEAFFAWVALGIMPAIFFGLLWVKGANTSTGKAPRRQWNGLIPSFKNLLYGSGNTHGQSSTTVLQKDAPAPKKVAVSKNGRDNEVNP